MVRSIIILCLLYLGMQLFLLGLGSIVPDKICMLLPNFQQFFSCCLNSTGVTFLLLFSIAQIFRTRKVHLICKRARWQWRGISILFMQLPLKEIFMSQEISTKYSTEVLERPKPRSFHSVLFAMINICFHFEHMVHSFLLNRISVIRRMWNKCSYVYMYNIACFMPLAAIYWQENKKSSSQTESPEKLFY